MHSLSLVNHLTAIRNDKIEVNFAWLNNDNNPFQTKMYQSFKPTEFLPSLNQEELIYRGLFTLPTTSGLHVMSSSKIDEETEITTHLFLQPITISLGHNQKGQLITKANQTAAAKFIYAKANSNGRIMLSLGSNPYALINIKPNKQISLSTQINYFNGNIKPSINISTLHKHFHPAFKINFKGQPLITVDGNQFKFFKTDLIDTLDFTFTVGTHNFSGGLQVVRRFVQVQNQTVPVDSYSGLVQRKWNDNNVQLGFVWNKPSSPALLWRYIKNINKKWTAGVQYMIDANFISKAEATYNCEIGKNTVRGLINSDSQVISTFNRKISDNFNFAISGFLDHERKDYRIGISLDFENQ